MANKRLERVEQVKNALRVMHNEMRDARFEGNDIVIELENGYIFLIQGFISKEAFAQKTNTI